MASPLKLTAKDKAALRRSNKEKIRGLVSRGLELNQIEEELHKDGCRITAPLREFIIWEKRFPEVRKLLAQGLDVATIEERMRLNGWIWTDNLRQKALWEFHREEIIGLYKTVRSVESVHDIMTKKGFTPQTRIYYEWLHDWGVPTCIDRTNLSELEVWSHTSPFDSNSSATPGSTTGPYQQIHEYNEVAPLEASNSHFTDKLGNRNGVLPQDSSPCSIGLVASGEVAHINVYQPSGVLMDFDEEHKSSTVRDPSYLDMGTVRSVTSSQYSHEPQPTTQGGQLNHYNTPQFSALGDSFLDDNDSDKSHQGEEMHGSHHISKRHDTTVLPSSSARVVPPWVDWEVGNASQSMRGPFTCLQGNPIQQNNNLASHQMAGDSMAHRKSTDSGYESKTISIISSGVESPRLSQLPRNLRNSLSQESDRQEWASQNTVLRSISCLENHQGMGFNFHCCGSSCLQDLAIFATNISPDRVYEFLCNYMRFEGVRLSDYAGNTFLHKLAVTGAPWAYFEAAFKARIDPCHLNAYEQTFAHVLNVSKFHDNLIECLSFIRELGIDLGRRDASGRTVLHYLYDQPISPQTAREILNLIETPGRLLCLRDVSGRTPCEIFKHTFQQQASTDPRWSSPEIQLQSIGIFEDIVDDGVLRLGDEGIDWHRVTNNPDELRSKLQSQYKEVIDNATNGIAVEAMDGSNAIHAQASLMAAQNAATDLCDLEKFISVGIDANDYDNRGRTPLEAIITQPRDYENELTKSEKVALLIDKGRASVNSRNRLGHTPLYSAAIRGLDRTVEVLLRRGSHVNIRANNNKSLLDAVQDAWDRALIEYLDSRLDSKYHEAQCSRIEACKVLLERYGAVSNPSPAQSMGYPVSRRPLRQ